MRDAPCGGLQAGLTNQRSIRWRASVQVVPVARSPSTFAFPVEQVRAEAPGGAVEAPGAVEVPACDSAVVAEPV